MWLHPCQWHEPYHEVTGRSPINQLFRPAVLKHSQEASSSVCACRAAERPMTDHVLQ